MRSVAIILLSACLCAIALAHPGELKAKYTTKYDNVNLDEILNSERLLGNYYKCLTDEGNCSPDGAELKRIIPDALQNGCEGCSDRQKEGGKRVANYILEHKPEWFTVLEEKYDPTGEFRKRYEEDARKAGINI